MKVYIKFLIYTFYKSFFYVTSIMLSLVFILNLLNELEFFKDINVKVIKNLKKFLDEEKSRLNIQRFKGLGEMNPEELWETTLNPINRTLLLVKYSNNTKAKSKKDQDLFQVLMGDEVAPRKEFITNNALDVANLDI